MQARAALAGRSANPVAVRDHRRNLSCRSSGVRVSALALQIGARQDIAVDRPNPSATRRVKGLTSLCMNCHAEPNIQQELGRCVGKRFLLYHLVSDTHHVGRHGQPDRSGCLQVDNQLEFARLDHRQVRRLLAFEDSAGVAAGLSIGIA